MLIFVSVLNFQSTQFPIWLGLFLLIEAPELTILNKMHCNIKNKISLFYMVLIEPLFQLGRSVLQAGDESVS